jgi:tetratricopeptide (TPR) repeat protein
MSRRFLALLCATILPIAISAQAPRTAAKSATARFGPGGRTPRGSPAPRDRANADHSQEALLVEKYATTVRFQNDGRGERELSVRMRIETAASAQVLRALSFSYDSATEKMELGYLRVRKPDGSIVNASASAATEEPAGDATAMKNAPAYAREKLFRIALPPLAAGDTLAYEIVTRIVTPEAPGQFWFQHNFLSGTPARNERLEINVPANRAVIVRSPHFAYEKIVAGGRAIYLWKRADARSPSTAKPAEKQSAPGDQQPPDVALTSFATWAEVAHWYASLERDRAEPDAAIRAKTAELTNGLATDLAKIQALYDYVSKSIRYVSVPFGAAGYRPRRAADVFASGYADAQDEQVLLAAMLQATGFRAEAALIPYTRRLDIAVPSLAQFEHVLTAVPVGSETIWMDSTVGLAPFRLLPAPLRGKPALLIASDGPGRIVDTPADPPFRSVQHVDIDGSVSPLGKLVAQAHYSLLGDTELALRLAFQTTPQSQWNDLGQTVLAFDGIRGEVTSVEPRNLGEAEEPFEFDIHFNEPNFFDWSATSTTAAMPLLAIGLPNPPQGHNRPVDIGSPLTVDVRLRLQLPDHFAAEPPVGTAIARDFAEFKSSYHFADHVLSAERSLGFKMRELPAARLSDYLAFTRAVTLDQNQPLAIDFTGPGKPSIPESAKPDDLLAAGLAALNAGNAPSAIPLFQRVVQADPHYKDAWNDLGLAYLRLGKYAEAASTFRKQLEVNPADEHAGNYLGVALERQQDFQGAIAAFRKQAEDHPLDPVAHAALGELLVDQHEYAAAIPELEKGGVLAPKNAALHIALGRAYLNLDKLAEAANAFDRAARISATPPILNEIADQLASRKMALDQAQKYAEAAVAGTGEDLRGIDLSRAGADQLADVTQLGAYWDTLGWVYLQQGDLKKAEPYIRAAWLLNLDGQAGDHLAQVYQKLGEKDRAIQMCALALATANPLPDTRARLTLLLGGNSRIDSLVAQAKPEVEKLREIPAGKFAGREDAHAEFLVLLSPGQKMPRVDGVRFLSGDDQLRPLGERLRSLDYGEIFPDDAPVQLIRRGDLACSAKSAACIFTLALPENVRPSN